MAKAMVLVMLTVLAVGTALAAATAGSGVMAGGVALMAVGIALLARLPWVPRADHGLVLRKATVAVGCYLAGVVVAALAISRLD